MITNILLGFILIFQVMNATALCGIDTELESMKYDIAAIRNHTFETSLNTLRYECEE